jgi:hypothetical protein
LDGPAIIMFAPRIGPAGAMEPKRFASHQQLSSFLDELGGDPAAQRLAVADLERHETAIIPSVRLTTAELREHWPRQFAEKSCAVAVTEDIDSQIERANDHRAGD